MRHSDARLLSLLPPFQRQVLLCSSLHGVENESWLTHTPQDRNARRPPTSILTSCAPSGLHGQIGHHIMFSTDVLSIARIQFAFTVSLHIIFPALSIGLSSFIAVLEALWLKTGRQVYKDLCL